MLVCRGCNKEFSTNVKIDTKWISLTSRRFCLECSPYIPSSERVYSKVCKKCGKEFPTYIKIDGIGRNLGKRVYCLECYPFGKKRVKKERYTKVKSFECIDGKYICPECREGFTKYSIGIHIWKAHGEGKSKKVSERWSKYWTGKTHSDVTKEKISKIMKERHREGKAHNLYSNRWDGESSYPEKFFEKVIENEFEDKDYTREYVVNKYRIDFAWVGKKLAIEIDGEQHEEEDRKEIDKRKDELLVSRGWRVLRIRWRDMYNNPKVFIDKAREFIDV